MPTLPAWGVICFFTSGVAGLLYEVVWTKQLSYLLGNSLHAAATVVAAFLGGLALGARFLGTPLAQRRRGPRDYALLELGVGVLGIALLPVLRGLEPLVGQFYRAFGGEGPSFALARFVLLFVVLIPPAALMGATLPVLVAHFEWERVGPALARLYALNTFGAVLGSLAGGFVFMPWLGLSGTAAVAALLNASVALLAWRAGGATRAAPAAASADAPAPTAKPAAMPTAPAPGPAAAQSTPAEAEPSVAPPLAGPARLALASLFALSGLAALAFQIAWVRLFSLVFGSSVYSFSAVLGVYVFGLALGSAVIERAMRRGVSLAGFARLQLTLAAVAAVELLCFPRLPEWMFALGERSGASWGALMAGEIGLAAVMLLVPCALLGAAFPIATRLLQRRDGGHAAGFAYAVNTIGTIAGSLLAGFVLVPTWGVQGTHLAALILSGFVGLGALALARSRGGATGRDLAFAGGAVAVVAALGMLAPRWDPALMSSGLYRPRQAADVAFEAGRVSGAGSTVWRATRSEKVLFYREGVNGSVLVGTDEQGTQRWLRVGGKIDASTSDMETQVLLGLLPTLCADSAARTLVIGLGSGITAAAALAAGAGPTEVVELEPGVVQASRFFHAPGEDPLDDPRVHLILGDARTHLAHGGGRYGVIVSEPSNPWIAGVNNLFTVDFYHRVRARLAPGGVFCQWMQLYELSPETFASMLASFLDVFPQGQVFCVWNSVDVLLVAAPDDRRLAIERLATPAGRRLLARARIRAPEALAGYYAGPFAALRPIAKGAPLNRDDRPIVEYRAPRDLIEIGRTALFGSPRVIGEVPFAAAPPPGPLFAAWSREGWYEARGRMLMDAGQLGRVRTVARDARAAGLDALAASLAGGADATDRRQRGLLEVQRATALINQGADAAGRAALERATEIDPANARAWVMLADRLRMAGDSLGTAAALGHALTSPDSAIRADALDVAALVAVERGRLPEAAARFAEAQRLMPRDVRHYALEARARAAIGDRAGAIAALRRGLAAVPADAGLAQMLRSMGGGG